MNKLIENYNFNGKVYVWKYLENYKNYPGWNFTVDKMAAKQLTELFSLMLSSEFPTKKKIETSVPSKPQLEVPNNLHGKADYKTKSTVVFNLKKSGKSDLWNIVEQDDSLEIILGIEKLYELNNAIGKILLGEGDFAIYDKNEKSRDNLFYIWWNLEK